jgi:hypothetical protein
MPRGLLSYSKFPRNLVAGHAVLAVAEHPQSNEPFIQRERRILEETVYLDAELLAARIALPTLLSGKPVVFTVTLFNSALRANGLAVRPAERGNRINANLLIRVVPNRFRQRLGYIHASTFTNPIVAKVSGLVKVSFEDFYNLRIGLYIIDINR